MGLGFFNKNSNKQRPGSILPDIRIYAIGDIHGRLDLIKKLHEKIRIDSEDCNASTKILLYLGDYIDRGIESKGVVDLLISDHMQDFKKVYLKGNHEAALQLFLENCNEADAWLAWGGIATIQSYGVAIRDKNGRRINSELAAELKSKISAGHRHFYNTLHLYYTNGDYLFVHAGIKPGVSFENQNPNDILNIRDEFIFSKQDPDKIVVFGHTVFEKPYFANGKIGVDTGAYASGVLTAVVLENDDVRFIST